MSTKRAAGTQFTQKGVVQGNSLVDPKTGQPVDVIIDGDGKHRLAVDANISATIGDISVELDAQNDSVRVEDPNTGAHIRVEPDGSINANVTLDVAEDAVTTPVIFNLNVPLKNTEVSYLLPTNTKRFQLKARLASKIKLAYNSGQSNTSYYTIDPGTVHEEKDLNTSVVSITVYLQTSKDNETIEILSWS